MAVELSLSFKSSSLTKICNHNLPSLLLFPLSRLLLSLIPPNSISRWPVLMSFTYSLPPLPKLCNGGGASHGFGSYCWRVNSRATCHQQHFLRIQSPCRYHFGPNRQTFSSNSFQISEPSKKQKIQDITPKVSAKDETSESMEIEEDKEKGSTKRRSLRVKEMEIETKKVLDTVRVDREKEKSTPKKQSKVAVVGKKRTKQESEEGEGISAQDDGGNIAVGEIKSVDEGRKKTNKDKDTTKSNLGEEGDHLQEEKEESGSEKKIRNTKAGEVKGETIVNNKNDTIESSKNTKKGGSKAALAASAITASLNASQNTEPWTVLVHRKAQSDWVAYNPATMRQTPVPVGKQELLKIISWNVNGLRSLLKWKSKGGNKKGGNKKGGKGKGEDILSEGEALETEISALSQLSERERPDFICLQETKLQEKDAEEIKQELLPTYKYSYWSCSTAKLGYSGCALFSKKKPKNVTYGLGLPEHDFEGRVITAEFDNFFLINVYVPNAGEKLDRLSYREKEWDPALGNHMKELEKKKPVILTGDLNVAYEEIDIHHPDGNRKSAGFTDEERTSFEICFLNGGFSDTFRVQHPKAVGYSYWGYRSGARPKNTGWRLDYFLASQSIVNSKFDSFTVPDVVGSDHCPIGLSFLL